MSMAAFHCGRPWVASPDRLTVAVVVVVVEMPFRRPYPPTACHGSVCGTTQKEPRFVMPPEELGWLNQNVLHSTGQALMRPVVAYQATKANFRNRLRQDTKTPMWLEKYQVVNCLTEQRTEEKEKRERERTARKTTDTNKKSKMKVGGKRKEPSTGTE